MVLPSPRATSTSAILSVSTRVLFRAIDEARAAAALGVPVSEVLRAAQQVLDAEEGVEPDYAQLWMTMIHFACGKRECSRPG